MITLLKQDHVRTARAKGLSERAVLVKHALRNALMPLVTVVGLSMGTRGRRRDRHGEDLPLARRSGRSASTRCSNAMDPVVMGVVILLSIVVVTSNLLVDVLYAVLDPRTRRQ